MKQTVRPTGKATPPFCLNWAEETDELVGFWFQRKYKKLMEDSSPSASSAVRPKFQKFIDSSLELICKL